MYSQFMMHGQKNIKLDYKRSRYFSRSGIESVQIALNLIYGPALYGTWRLLPRSQLLATCP